MNWYKRSQQLEIEETHKDDYRNYTDYGHDIHNRVDDYEYEEEEEFKPNYMWEYNQGEIDIEEETEETPGHAYVDRWKFTNSYSGRYEGDRGIITLVKPYDGVARFRDVPSIIQFKLRRAFPEAKKIVVF